MRSVDAVFCESEALAAEVRASGVDESRIVLDPPGSSAEKGVARHVKVYSAFMRERGAG